MPDDPATTVATHDTPVGSLTLSATDAGLSRCLFGPVRHDAGPEAHPTAQTWLNLARRELDAYFAGELREFTVPVDLRRVRPLHHRVLTELRHVGYGSTTSYGHLAAAVGLSDDGPRQVGAMMARNPVAVVVPCHRVLGADGKLVGYAGGLLTKQRLLDLEAPARTLDLAW